MDCLLNPSTPGPTGKTLVADVHCAQQSDTVKSLIAKTKTALVNIGGGITSYLQVVDVTVNKPFKDYVKTMSEEHIEDNLKLYTEGKITTLQRRILMKVWCGKAWSKIDHDSVGKGLFWCNQERKQE